jgi:hypothetical protein
MIAKKKSILMLAVALLLISVIWAIGGVVLPLISHPTVTYVQCMNVFNPATLVNVPGWFYATSCILTGYSPPDLQWLTITSFAIFGIILPIVFLYVLFWQFMPTEMISDSNVRRVIAFIAAMFAYRGFVATYFIDTLSYGFAGIGAMLVGVLFVGFVWKAALGFVRPLGIEGKEEVKDLMLGEVQMIKREMQQLEAAATIALEHGMEEKYKKLLAEVDRLAKRLDELTGKGK